MRSTDLHIASPYTREGFAADVAFYLQQTPRQLPSRYFYDGLGSALFDAICRLPWYWVARAELETPRKAVMRPSNESAPEVSLDWRITHADDYWKAVTDEDRDALARLEKRLTAMGVKSGHW